ncbi:hypothetical protein [Sphingopyxis terrae]|uniref:hypothetical protein n=1 Tax=Sphingopyxis terrae TaxID=33052 RepID=UPI00361A2CC6
MTDADDQPQIAGWVDPRDDDHRFLGRHDQVARLFSRIGQFVHHGQRDLKQTLERRALHAQQK